MTNWEGVQEPETSLNGIRNLYFDLVTYGRHIGTCPLFNGMPAINPERVSIQVCTCGYLHALDRAEKLYLSAIDKPTT